MRMLNRWRQIVGSLLAVAAFATPAVAQDEPRFALVASFPTPTVSFQWELNDRIGIRVDGSYTYRDESTDIVSDVSSFNERTLGTVYVLQTLTHSESTTNTGSIGVAGCSPYIAATTCVCMSRRGSWCRILDNAFPTRPRLSGIRYQA